MAGTIPRTLKLATSLPGLEVTTPAIVYGTAWKKEDTAKLVKTAISVGFRGVDTAAQPKHYREDLVGQGIRDAINEGIVKREELYIQTKFTPYYSQNPTDMPYELDDPIPTQIHTSLAYSFKNLTTTANPSESYLDCLVLHGPMPTPEQTLLAWRTLESYVPHRIRSLGISNVIISDLTNLYAHCTIKPAVVQNRFYWGNQYDPDIRRFCLDNKIIFQSYWTLTANQNLTTCRAVERVIDGAEVGMAVAIYALTMGLGYTVPLCGSRDKGRLERDLEGIEMVREWAAREPGKWDLACEQYREELKRVVLPTPRPARMATDGEVQSSTSEDEKSR